MNLHKVNPTCPLTLWSIVSGSDLRVPSFIDDSELAGQPKNQRWQRASHINTVFLREPRQRRHKARDSVLQVLACHQAGGPV